MSIVSFNRKFEASVRMSGSSYDTRGFAFRDKAYSGFTGSFDVEYKVQGVTAPIKQQACYAEPDRTYDYARPAFTSGAMDSGHAIMGFPKYVEKTFLAQTLISNYGKWIANTKPEITYEKDEFGRGKVEVDGDETTVNRVYTVQNPEKDLGEDVSRNDVPIYLAPGIVTAVTNAVVYEGDIIYIYRDNVESFAIKIIRQKRYPKPDRTFFWTPNTSPVLTKGGYSDGILVKPGTVMIPTRTTSLRAYDGGEAPDPDIPPNEVLSIDYVYAGQGIVFDGDDWISLSGVPTRLLKKDGKYAHRNEGLAGKYIDEDQPHISLTERFYANRPRILLSAPVDSSPSGQANLTAVRPGPDDPPPPEPPTDLTLELYSAERAFFYLLYDFGDAWSSYHQANKDWRDNIFIEYEDLYTFGWGVETAPEPVPPPDPDGGGGDSGDGGGDSDPAAASDDGPDPGTGELLEPFIVFAPSQTFRDGEVTTVEIKNLDGDVVAGSTLSITIRVQLQG
jgi:hypothetical protein